MTEEAMAKNAGIMAEKGVTENDGGAVIADFTRQVPGKEGKQLAKAVLR